MGSLGKKASPSLGMTVIEGIDGQSQVAGTPRLSTSRQSIAAETFHMYATVFLQCHPI